MIKHVPPGGNWQDIPESVPSKRLEQIRESYRQGKGSRSTYYGRLEWGKPSYTISTYFNRPGNGCHIHPENDRVLTHREAARLQSFPDWYHFYGPMTEVRNQIGNAVPPLLATFISQFLEIENFVDLFCGAGGLSLGLEATGVEPIIAVDSKERACRTYRENRGNLSPPVLCADLSTESTKKRVVSEAEEYLGGVDAVVGGPPCQGFSHAGNAREKNDPRNLLVYDFINLVDRLRPRVFVMENVTGIRTIEGGEILNFIRKEFQRIGYPNTVNMVMASDFGVPQRRKRVFIIGARDASPHHLPKRLIDEKTWTTLDHAIRDLPDQPADDDDTKVTHKSNPQCAYQEMVRGCMGYPEFLSRLSEWTDIELPAE